MSRFNIFIVTLLLALSFIPFISTPAYAGEPKEELKFGDRIILDTGEQSTYIGKTYDGRYAFIATLGRPEYIPGTSTPIGTNWVYNPSLTQWETKDNIFEAIVKDSKVTIFMNGQKMSWEPTILVGTKDTKALDKAPDQLWQDPENEHYYTNTLEWDFGVAKRRLRQIEGVLQETFIFYSNPGEDIQIKSNLYKDPNFIWDRDPFAYDAEGRRIKISQDKVVLASEFAREDIVYPVTVDPTSTYVTSSSDGYLVANDGQGRNWAATRGLGTADALSNSGNTLRSVDFYSTTYGDYSIERAYLYFDTSGLPDSATVSNATLSIYGATVYDNDNAGVYIVNGMSTYPHDPLVTSDFGYTNYGSFSSNYGYTTSPTTGAYFDVNELNAGALAGIVNKAGTTKIALVERRDYVNETPGSFETNLVEFYAYEKGNGYWPQLEVVYTAADPPTVSGKATSDISTTTAKLNGYLDYDGGEECQVKFLYDTDSGDPYANDTGWLAANYTSAQSFSDTISGLNTDDIYYVIVQAHNVAGTTNSTEYTFSTLASLNPPTDLQGTPRSSSEISYSWVKGVGSSHTLLRGKEGDYPTSTTDGFLVCNTTRSSATLEGLDPGTTIYVKGWGYDAGSFSTTNTTEVATTFIGSSAGTSPIGAPSTPNNFFGPPTYTNLSNLPFYENFNARAVDMDIPVANFWMFLFFGMSVVLGASFFLVSKSIPIGMLGTGMGLAWGYGAGPIPGVWIMLYIIAAVSILYVTNKGGSYA